MIEKMRSISQAGGQCMCLRPITLKSLGILLYVLVLAIAASTQQAPTAQDENDRAIVADEFLKNRRGKSNKSPNTYHVATSAKRSDRPKLQIGVTIWKLEPATAESSGPERSASGSYW